MPLVYDDERDFDKGEWVEYEEGVEFQLRPLDKKAFRKMRKTATPNKPVRGSRRKQTVADTIDDEAFDHALFDYIILGWKGVVDKRGKDLPCTPENKAKVTDRMINLASWLIDEASFLAEDAQIELGEKAGNS